ncbi:low molecular weight protein-tyrosine-phosphatase [Hyunsoonleella pacifica]|uniref:protein-tyrosine-phosphatase n=1 Tax=Hyunsoonleella pacifica TaxID=1080224 RepID=A0A4Q9FUA6_9FLAO|nr:low molecular weight protein-tyrosine-phosphatase [Hyunsoonleella pacifica]TBN18879.1 low molecular weight phosphotyrosine protein phosphatase [Hyunsoonleella pacifica]GGD05556.1 protein-tyrosine-phosphatase [Hyunsoonleella pacifica]
MTKILMVCLGNICRSPLAEGILRSKLPNDTFIVDSAGTAAYHIGSKPDSRSISVAQKHNIDITHLRGRQFVKSDFEEFDLIYAMDESNYNHIVSMAKNENDLSKVKLILNEITPNENLSVPDPYYGGNQGFDNVYKMLDEACEIIVIKLIS